jgi:hypothetical protein
MEMAQDRVLWGLFCMVVLNPRVLLPENQLVRRIIMKEVVWEVDVTGSE